MQGYPEHSGARNIDEAIENANSAPYRLAACAFTNSARNADRPADGAVASSAETPFGGFRDSAFGCEGGNEGLQCYTVVKNVSHLTT
jgi:succinate-semialdehyde dehydrogenase / glutarate-semialdehyde dehydrogenase